MRQYTTIETYGRKLPYLGILKISRRSQIKYKIYLKKPNHLENNFTLLCGVKHKTTQGSLNLKTM